MQCSLLPRYIYTYVIGYEKRGHFTQKLDLILRLQHLVKVHSLRFLLQFVSLN